jgi:chromosome segregation ATPase
MLEQNEASRQAKNEAMESVQQELAQARDQVTHLASVEAALVESKAALATMTAQYEAQADKHTDALLSAREELEGRVRELVGQTEAQKEQVAVLEDNLHSAQERYDVREACR